MTAAVEMPVDTPVVVAENVARVGVASEGEMQACVARWVGGLAVVSA